MPRKRKNAWVIVYDDGKTPQIHRAVIRGYTMYGALHDAHREIDPANIWACVLVGHEDVAAIILSGRERMTVFGSDVNKLSANVNAAIRFGYCPIGSIGIENGGELSQKVRRAPA
jgi:hypothetical protein